MTLKQTQGLRALRWHYAKDMHARALALKKTVEPMQKLQKTMSIKAARVLGASANKKGARPLSSFDFEPWGSIERQLEDLGKIQMPGFEDVTEMMLEETSLLTESERPMTLPYENGADNDMPEAVPEGEAAPDDATTEEEDEEDARGVVVVIDDN